MNILTTRTPPLLILGDVDCTNRHYKPNHTARESSQHKARTGGGILFPLLCDFLLDSPCLHAFTKFTLLILQSAGSSQISRLELPTREHGYCRYLGILLTR